MPPQVGLPRAGSWAVSQGSWLLSLHCGEGSGLWAKLSQLLLQLVSPAHQRVRLSCVVGSLCPGPPDLLALPWVEET